MNWIIFALVGIIVLIWLRIFFRKRYDSLLNSIRFDLRILLLAAAFLGLFIAREAWLVPFKEVAYWMPNSYLFEQLTMWLITIHAPSMILYALLILFAWRRFDNLALAGYIGAFAVGITEFTFIPQHLFTYGIFLGWSWYGPFIALAVPFIIERHRFNFDKRGLLFLFVGLSLQYLVLALLPWSISSFQPELLAWRLNPAVMPHLPLNSWIFIFGNYAMKISLTLAFAFIGVKKIEKS